MVSMKYLRPDYNTPARLRLNVKLDKNCHGDDKAGEVIELQKTLPSFVHVR